MTDGKNVFVSAGWLADHLGDPGVAIVDGSWYLPAANRDPEAEYLAGHIPGAVRFDIDKIADTSTGLPHMLPSEEQFAAAVGALGISEKQRIVVYDGAGLFAAPRVRWTFRAFGAADVRILDGGLPQWIADGHALEAGEAKPAHRTFHARLNRAYVRSLAQMRAIVADGSAAIVDARPGDRFRGEAPEPRPGLRSGHMPGSRSVPSSTVVDGRHLKDPAAIAGIFAEAGVDPKDPIVTSCGSGVTAAILALALETIGAEDVGLYDGAWAEWGGLNDAPIETGPAK